MKLRKLRRNWDRLGNDDPMWAILSDPSKRGNQWERDEFFGSGVEEINAALEKATAYHWSLERRRALDFGCGVGRLTAALAAHFDEVHGVDVAPSMIAKAKQFVGSDRCQFHANDADDLSLFADGCFDFIYSRITLQHIPPKLAVRYVAEFGRVLAPNGLLMIQIPSTPTGVPARWRRMIPRGVWELWYDAKSEIDEVARCRMFGVPVDKVADQLLTGGCQLLSITPDDSAGPGWHSYFYLATKPAAISETTSGRARVTSQHNDRVKAPSAS
jgi:SAM-dependent methyltransferase